MLLVLYDIQNDKLRTQLAKFLTRFGRRIQYSVFEMKNSQRILNNIKVELETKFQKRFSQEDSVLIYNVGDEANICRFGYPKNEETDLLLFD